MCRIRKGSATFRKPACPHLHSHRLPAITSGIDAEKLRLPLRQGSRDSGISARHQGIFAPLFELPQFSLPRYRTMTWLAVGCYDPLESARSIS